MSDTSTTTEESTEKVDYEAMLTEVLVRVAGEAGDTLTEEQVTEVQEAYRSIPAGARGKVQGLALKGVVTSGNTDSLPALIDAMANLPKATGGGRSRPQVDPKVALTVQAAGILVAFADVTSDEELGKDVAETAKAWFANGCPDEHRDAVLRAAASAVKGSKSRRGGGGGARRTFSETLADVVARLELKTPVAITYGKDNEGKAQVLKSGEIKIGNDTFANPSAAAKAVTADGKGQVNGWTFFRYDGKPLADLRVK